MTKRIKQHEHLSKLCVRIKWTFSKSLSKKYDNFSRTGPFLMYSSGNESYGHGASYAFGFIKKYLFFEKLESKTFCVMFFITRFSEKIFFQKRNRKIKNFDFSKNHFFEKKSSFQIFRSRKKIFFQKVYFFENI